jgi:hypothetical protein
MCVIVYGSASIPKHHHLCNDKGKIMDLKTRHAIIVFKHNLHEVNKCMSTGINQENLDLCFTELLIVYRELSSRLHNEGEKR